MFLRTSPENCRYTHLPNGIHEYVFLNNSRRAFDEFATHLERYMVAATRGEGIEPHLAIMIELREPGMPPVAYMAGRYRDLLIKYPNHLPPARIAYVHTEGFLISVVRTFLALLPNRNTVQRRFFYANQRGQAETWLLEVLEPATTVK